MYVQWLEAPAPNLLAYRSSLLSWCPLSLCVEVNGQYGIGQGLLLSVEDEERLGSALKDEPRLANLGQKWHSRCGNRKDESGFSVSGILSWGMNSLESGRGGGEEEKRKRKKRRRWLWPMDMGVDMASKDPETRVWREDRARWGRH